ncbi:Glycosyltransferase family 25 (LPS biosynthesis protein) [Thalassovita autumnalis]|uniref:Glycosyltransferase family 25 (LPS biosynthesis protein) n=1 Tax=Thalassovita autumnalis TaxID=2072972 RepID=A0A0P1FNN0_9RHOB|nr:glycosyltransferase family 25 protein [Thalassovita autumnalis]CUH70096.1 Glycosyltransferase family 25 (LPS biosynthesis protein) [Thalassovita autumnalis]CUH73269.1 Glycosyltransferase family 25 (LPS biosynthesis protein) [Thalassovita autumnalis]
MMGINDYFWSDLFDKIYVVSLPESKDRRSYVAEHLKGVGIRQFEWFDACGPDHPDVKSLFEQQKVRQFPPCFRCGKLSCGSDECNNILIPQQVAVFATYLRLWRQIASSNETALILEDDVRIHEQFAPVLSKLKHWVDTGELEFEAKTPKLLRLGWAYGSDHEAASKDVRVSQEIRMANPCHAMTSAFARIVIEKFEDVSHTADVFLHRDVAEDHQAVTIFPPIASELSWSVGSLPSLIHPKAKRVDYLIEQGLRQEADDYQESIRHHRNHIYHRKFLIVGHPRTGTGFAASLLRQMGFDIGHETDGVDGVASWMMSVDDPKNPWAGHPIAERRSNLFWDHCLHVVRNPMTALPAITRENQYAPKSLGSGPIDFRVGA